MTDYRLDDLAEAALELERRDVVLLALVAVCAAGIVFCSRVGRS